MNPVLLAWLQTPNGKRAPAWQRDALALLRLPPHMEPIPESYDHLLGALDAMLAVSKPGPTKLLD